MSGWRIQKKLPLNASGPALPFLFFLALVLPPVFLFLPLLFFISLLSLNRPRDPDPLPAVSLYSPDFFSRAPPFHPSPF